MQYNDQQKNIETYLNNIPYLSKAAVYDHVCRFIRENEYFWARSNIQKTVNNQFFCYIELVGYVHIGKNMIEMRIMIPHNYPLAPPQFDLLYNSSSYMIVNQGALVNSQAIYVRKNEAEQQLIRLNLESIRRTWANDKIKHLCQVFATICRQINLPPLLVSNGNEAPGSKSLIDFRVSRNRSSGMSERFIEEIQVKICTLQEKQSKVEAAKRQLQNHEVRTDFILRNASKLQKSIKTQQNKINKQLIELRSRHQQMLLNNSVNPLLQISEKDKNKIKAVARRDALKEAEKKVTQCIERNLTQSTSGAFDQHRNLIRHMYQEMFDSQLQYLKLCE